ncbi:hypothetical protein EHQ12_10725 [Leptospira gomenensis]|uniref:Uncharacterized protein n=1 Tax=Leptospira gomenensis TaxID=2484974 RepID=A0A5F1YIN1_9LEPT|nr:hypothetical protein [Leptospira gomenensis]TGK38207.1 hypothetical protein EHQ12_10725 [Leptospira gomenensis]TGK38433.1 hypothetical protein EHQ17_01980 [Leptospira gomenensis]TGK52247.1 hypothetical protein EHQ07_01400 [Leptospira gomenensis]TGK55766.1 hypothetical protein EHQ13_16530 [Leptospira gomenensis]
MKKTIPILYLFVVTTPSLFGTEILLKNGESYFSENVEEGTDAVKFRWKSKLYQIPNEEIQRIDPTKRGADVSYKYREFRLTDGSVIRGIVVEKGKRIVVKTDLGFLELDKTKFQIFETDKIEEQNPEVPEKYRIDPFGSGQIYVGGSIIGAANLGIWSRSHPVTYGGGLFLEKNITNTSYWFIGIVSEGSASPGTNGNLYLWNQTVYLGKQWGKNSPYFLLGGGITSVRWKGETNQTGGMDPEFMGEIGWSWNVTEGTRMRAGVRSQCTFETETSLCRSGIRISWGILL